MPQRVPPYQFAPKSRDRRADFRIFRGLVLAAPHACVDHRPQDVLAELLENGQMENVERVECKCLGWCNAQARVQYGKSMGAQGLFRPPSEHDGNSMFRCGATCFEFADVKEAG